MASSSSKQQTKERAKPLVEAYKRAHFDRVRQELVTELEDEKNKADKEKFLTSVQDTVWRTMQQDAQRKLPDRPEDDAVEHLLKELDRYPLIDLLLEKLFEKPELLRDMKKELRTLWTAQMESNE